MRAAFLLLALGMYGSAAGTPPTASYAPGRLIVKLDAGLAPTARAAVRGSGGLAAALGVPQLDALLRRDGMRTVRAPFAARMQRASGLAGRFPRRAARAGAGAAPPGLERVFIVELSPTLDMEQVAAEYARLPGVEYAEPDRIMEAVFVPNDPFMTSSGSWGQTYPDLWGLLAIDAPSAWDVTRGAGVVVAITDTGIDMAQPDIAGQMWTNPGEIPGNGIDDDGDGFVDDIHGWDFFNRDADPFDDFGHGTHVAGTVAAAGNNGLGIAGVAYEAKVMAVKGLGSQGGGHISTLIETIVYAIDNGADVINASWGGPESQLLSDAIAAGHAAGVVFVAAAGNAGGDFIDRFGPANVPDAITVSAFSHTDTIAFFSSFGPKVDVGAPGGGDAAPPAFEPFRSILSLRSSGTKFDPLLDVGGIYTREAGTSMAAPHVAGAAALVLAVHPEYSVEQVRQALRASSDDVDTPGYDLHSGYGRINAGRAVRLSNVIAARITSPTNRAPVDGAVYVEGTVAGAGFVSWTLEYGPGALPTSWLPIAGPSPTPVDSGPLATWDVGSLPDGTYVIRLRAMNVDGAIFEDRVPVVIDNVIITSPRRGTWASLAGGSIEIRGTAAGVGFQRYRVEYRTITPNQPPGPWKATGVSLTGGGTTPVTNGLLATLDPAAAGPNEVDLRLVVTTDTGELIDEVDHVIIDPTLRAGWPKAVGDSSVKPRNVTLVDLDGDGTKEILFSFGNAVYALRADGTDAPGWPQHACSTCTFAETAPAAADLDGDHLPEVVVTGQPSVNVFHGDGTSMVALPLRGEPWGADNVVLADLDRDGRRDLVYVENPFLYARHVDGSDLPGFPVLSLCFRVAECFETTVAVGDVDADGNPEVAVVGNDEFEEQFLHVYGNDAREKPGWPKRISRHRRIVGNSPVLADLDGDGVLDLTFTWEKAKLMAYTGLAKRIHLQSPSKLTALPRIYQGGFPPQQEPLVAGDLDGDGGAELMVAMSWPGPLIKRGETNELDPPYAGVDYLNVRSGGPGLGGWPAMFIFSHGIKVSGPGLAVVGDIDGDGEQDVLVGSGTCVFWDDSVSPHLRRCFPVAALHAHGTLLAGFPKRTVQHGVGANTSPAIGDLDADGRVEVVWLDADGRVVVWNVQGTPGPENLQWPMFRHDPAHTGALTATW